MLLGSWVKCKDLDSANFKFDAVLIVKMELLLTKGFINDERREIWF